MVLDRVLKKIIIKKSFWDTIPDHIPNFNAIWPTSSTANVFSANTENIHTEILSFLVAVFYLTRQYFTVARYLNNVSCNTTIPMEIVVPGKVVIDRNMIWNRTFVVSLMAKTRIILITL